MAVMAWMILDGKNRPQVESSTEEHRSATSPFNDVAGGALMLLEIGSYICYWDFLGM